MGSKSKNMDWSHADRIVFTATPGPRTTTKAPSKAMVTLSCEGSPTIKKCSCDCKAGNWNCSHCLALLYLICQYQKQELQSIPPVESKTSRPQVWNIPKRTDGLHVEAVDSIQINKVKPSADMKKRKRKQKVTEGVVPKVYCPVQQPIPHQEFSHTLIQQLSSINSDAQILRLLPDQSRTTDTRFGPVPVGSILSYQQKKIALQEEDIINHPDHPVFPNCSLPQLTSTYSTALCQGETDTLCGLQITEE